MAKRRRLSTLLEAIESAPSSVERAIAHYDLGLFHDNNGREAEAIPHYEAALELGLDGPVESEALAWLASSLYKTGSPEEALTRVRQPHSLTSDAELIRFLVRLEKRIQRRG
jgi:tetratricopeptide (TPR) repeat protein